MFSSHAGAPPAELVLASFEPLAIFFIAGAVLMIGATGWAIMSPDSTERGESGDEVEVKTPEH